MPRWRTCGVKKRRRLRVEKKKKREQGEASDWISEHIAHYSPRRGCEIFSQLDLAVEVLTACDVVGGVCVCVCVSACTYCCSDTGVSLKQKRERRGVAESKEKNNFLALCFGRCNDASASSMNVTWRVTDEAHVALLDKRHARQDEERYFFWTFPCCLLHAPITNPVWEHVCRAMERKFKWTGLQRVCGKLRGQFMQQKHSPFVKKWISSYLLSFSLSDSKQNWFTYTTYNNISLATILMDWLFGCLSTPNICWFQFEHVRVYHLEWYILKLGDWRCS